MDQLRTTPGYTEASLVVQKQLAHNPTWFIQQKGRHLNPASIASALGKVLVTAFLAGFVNDATGSANQADRSVFQPLDRLIEGLLSGHMDMHESGIEDLAIQAPAVVAVSTPSDTYVYAENCEIRLEAFLATRLPKNHAESLARLIRTAVLRNIFDMPSF